MSESPPDSDSKPKTEEALIGLQQRAAVAELMAGTVHDARNIMTGVLSFAQIGQRRDSDPTSKPLFDDIAAEAMRCVDLLEQILHLLRGSPLPDGHPVPVPLRPVVDSVGSLVRGEARLKRVRLEVLVPSTVTVLAYERSVLQIALNLVLNAVQATCPDSSVQVTARTSGTTVELLVTDAGSGVPEAQREEIFSSFVSTKGLNGTGLGLSISRLLARQLGGDVVLLRCGGSGAGATFCLTLPAATGTEP